MDVFLLLNASGNSIFEKHFTNGQIKKQDIDDVIDKFKQYKNKDKDKNQVLNEIVFVEDRANSSSITTDNFVITDDYNFNDDDLTQSKQDFFYSPVKKFSSNLWTFRDKICFFIIKRNPLYFVALLQNEYNPILIFEILNQINVVFVNYFGKDLNEDIIKSNFCTVHLLMEEMIYCGFPSFLELNIIELLVPRQSVMTKALRIISESSKLFSRFSLPFNLPLGSNKINGENRQLGMDQADEILLGKGSGNGFGSGIGGCGSHIWWRKRVTNYSSNEIYLDVVEKLNFIIDSKGNLIDSSVSGSVHINSKLSGLPTVNLSFRKANFSSSSFHPSIKVKKVLDSDRISFCPPDGETCLLKYWVNDTKLSPPIKVKAECKFTDNLTGGLFEMSIFSSDIFVNGLSGCGKISLGSPVENISLLVLFPRGFYLSSLSASIGTIN